MAGSLRLTLRTLLSYLDDTLDPAQAKLIGQKVAESEQARELMERIRQVTRKRRLTTPPPAGPGGIDANTIAEYLDNEVTPEQAEEVERICLASDVHLAEVAGCHQILTLVLGEPALVPPSARQRMYGLVKGPEAIPFRKPPRKKPQADLDLSTSDAGLDGDESMRMAGFMRSASMRNTVLLAGGGLVAACVLVLALYQLFRDKDRPVNNQQIVQLEGKKDDNGKTDGTKDDGKKQADQKERDAEAKKQAEQKQREAEAKKQAQQKQLDAEAKKQPEAKKTIDPKTAVDPPTGQEDVPYGPPDVTPVVLGTYQPDAKAPDVTLQRQEADKGNWERLALNNTKVASVRPLMSLPASRGRIQLNKGVHLTLWGTSPEIWPNPYIYESRVRLYDHPALALDMTLERGRVAIKNTRTDGKPAMVRVRFENPLQKTEEAFTIALMDPDAEAIIERAAFFPLGVPFHEDRNAKDRLPPIVVIQCVMTAGTAYFRWAGNLDFIDATKRPQQMQWISAQGKTVGPEEMKAIPDWALAKPQVGDTKMRKEAVAATKRLAANLQGKQLDVLLKESLDSDNPATKKLGLFCCTAVDDFATPLDYLSNDMPAQSDLRQTSVYALRYWMAQGPDSEYRVYEALQGTYKAVIAKKLMELLHGMTAEDQANPASWQRLIDDLDNQVLPMRELSAWNLLVALAPRLPKAAQLIATRYASIAPQDLRAQVQRELRVQIPRGTLPPQPQQPGAAPSGPASKKK